MGIYLSTKQMNGVNLLLAIEEVPTCNCGPWTPPVETHHVYSRSRQDR